MYNMYIYYQSPVRLIPWFCTTSIQYPSGSRINAMLCIRPSVRRFLKFTFRDSKRSHAASRSSTEIPNSKFSIGKQLKVVLSLTDMTETLGLSVAVVVDRALLLLGAIVPGQL